MFSHFWKRGMGLDHSRTRQNQTDDKRYRVITRYHHSSSKSPSPHIPSHHEQDAVLPLAVRQRGVQEPNVLHARRRPRQGRQGHLQRVQPPPTALRRRGRAHARAPQARVDARRDARHFQLYGHVTLLPQAAGGCPRGARAGRRHHAVANTVHHRTSAPAPTFTTTTTATTTVII